MNTPKRKRLPKGWQKVKPVNCHFILKWHKSKMYGNTVTATCYLCYIHDVQYHSVEATQRHGGCGYDKESHSMGCTLREVKEKLYKKKLFVPVFFYEGGRWNDNYWESQWKENCTNHNVFTSEERYASADFRATPKTKYDWVKSKLVNLWNSEVDDLIKYVIPNQTNKKRT